MVSLVKIINQSDPINNMKTKNKYSLPLKKQDIKEIKKGRKASPAHKNWYPRYGDESNAIDLYCPKNAKVLASCDGEVKWVKDNSKKGGKDLKYLDDANGVTIANGNNEFTQYLHLAYKKVFVKTGNKVKKGQVIGEVGRTGFIPPKVYHLHFAVCRWTKKNPTPSDYKTLKVKFEN